MRYKDYLQDSYLQEKFLSYVKRDLTELSRKDQYDDDSMGRVFPVYESPTPEDLKDLKREEKKAGREYIGERFFISTAGKIYMWSANIGHKEAVIRIIYLYPKVKMAHSLVYGEDEDAYEDYDVDSWYTGTSYLKPDQLKALQALHPKATFPTPSEPEEDDAPQKRAKELQNEEWIAYEKFKPYGTFAFYVNPTKDDVKEVEKDTEDKGEKHLGERYKYTASGKIYMWSADLPHDKAMELLQKKYPKEEFIANITYDKSNKEYWSSTKGWYDTLPEEIIEKLLRLHPEATFEAS